MPHILSYDPNTELNTLPFEGIAPLELVNLPKIDLHRHLVGAIRPEVLVYIAEKVGVTIPTFGNDAERIRKASVISSPVINGYKHFLSKRIWSAFQHIFSSSNGTANAIYWAIADASRDNICYVEFRVSPYGINRSFPLTLHHFIAALNEGIKSAARDFPQTLVKIILSVGRRSIIEKWPSKEHSRYYDRLLTVAKAFRDIIVGFDLSGDEDQYPNNLFIEFAQRVKTNDFKLTIHAGETDSAESIWEAMELLNADRIGHGIGARNDPALMRILAERGNPIEICPTSNWLLGIVPNLESHPCRDFIEKDMKVTINTDDPVLLGPTSLSMEFYRLLVAKQITPSDINKIQLNSVEASFANESEKASLLVKVNDHFFAEDQMMAAAG